MKKLHTTIIFSVVMMTIMLQSCMTGMQLNIVSTDKARISGNYTLMLYGCHYPDQVDNVAFLVDENSTYPFEIYDIETSYKTKKDVPAQQALTEADAFLQCSSHRIWQTQVTRIPDDSGGTVGYEVRPLYVPTEFGTPDVLMISYSLKDGKIRTYIRKLPPAQDRSGDGRNSRESGGHH